MDREATQPQAMPTNAHWVHWTVDRFMGKCEITISAWHTCSIQISSGCLVQCLVLSGAIHKTEFLSPWMTTYGLKALLLFKPFFKSFLPCIMADIWSHLHLHEPVSASIKTLKKSQTTRQFVDTVIYGCQNLLFHKISSCWTNYTWPILYEPLDLQLLAFQMASGQNPHLGPAIFFSFLNC